MTSIAEQPGAAAIVLDREEIDDDMNNVQSVYERIKVLTDAGRERANVELPYVRRGFSITNISGRTVHADGSSAPFEGKPFDKPVIRGNGIRVDVKSFTLPDVQFGSIIEYRYSLRYEDHMLLPPGSPDRAVSATSIFQIHSIPEPRQHVCAVGPRADRQWALMDAILGQWRTASTS